MNLSKFEIVLFELLFFKCSVLFYKRSPFCQKKKKKIIFQKKTTDLFFIKSKKKTNLTIKLLCENCCIYILDQINVLQSCQQGLQNTNCMFCKGVRHNTPNVSFDTI